MKGYFIKFLKLLLLYPSWLNTEVHTVSGLLTQYCYIQTKATAIGNNSASRFPVLWVVLFNVFFLNLSGFRKYAAKIGLYLVFRRLTGNDTFPLTWMHNRNLYLIHIGY